MSATVIMLEDLADFVLMGKITSKRIEEQFDVMLKFLFDCFLTFYKSS